MKIGDERGRLKKMKGESGGALKTMNLCNMINLHWLLAVN
jgi:hypothetical protein